MTTMPTFKFLVEYQALSGLALSSRFTNEKHAKNYVKSLKEEGFAPKLYSLDKSGKKDKEIKKK